MSMMPWVSASVVLLTMLVETTSYLGVMKKQVWFQIICRLGEIQQVEDLEYTIQNFT